jgi:two-component system sensor histidine kinase BaeS
VGWGEGRPPWWPADEPFPPDDWHRVRRRFFRRALVAVLVILAVLVAIGVAAASLGARHPGAAAVAVAAFVVVLVLVLRAFRRTTAPIAEVMAAADRVAAGDLGTRVTPSGPRATRRLGAAFNQMAERLEAQERHRRELFADVAHELRTPLAVLRGNLEGIVDGIYAADGTQLGLLVDQTDAMARLLEDLQTLSTAEAGALTLHREPTDVGALLRDAVAAFGPSAQRAGVSLTAEIAGDLPTDAELDPVRIGEVLRNLVVNAIRHTPAGGVVTVSAAIHEDGIRIAVSDTGRGIDADELPRVFDRFVRSADSGGHGLGLAIARALVEAHHGTISVESTAGAGATFRVDLPIGPAS